MEPTTTRRPLRSDTILLARPQGRRSGHAMSPLPSDRHADTKDGAGQGLPEQTGRSRVSLYSRTPAMGFLRVHPGSRSVSFACYIDHQGVKQGGVSQAVYVEKAKSLHRTVSSVAISQRDSPRVGGGKENNQSPKDLLSPRAGLGQNASGVYPVI